MIRHEMIKNVCREAKHVPVLISHHTGIKAFINIWTKGSLLDGTNR
jgi:hypothetical protein